MSFASIRYAMQCNRAARALRKVIPQQFGMSVTDIAVSHVDNHGAHFTAKCEGTAVEGTLTNRTVVEQSSRGNAVRVLREASIRPVGVWRGRAHNKESLLKLIAASA